MLKAWMGPVAVLVAFATIASSHTGSLLTVDQVISKSQETNAAGIPRITTWIPGTHKLLYSVRDGSVSEIFVYDQDTNTRQLITEGSYPVPAPDGRRFVFLRAKPTNDAITVTEHGVTTQICLGAYDGTEPTVLTTLSGVDPGWFEIRGGMSWSPDSRRLAYKIYGYIQSNRWHPPGNKDVVVYPDASLASLALLLPVDLHIFDIASESDRIIKRQRGQVSTIDWLNDQTVVYSHDNGKPFENEWSSVSALNVDSGETRTLVSGWHRQSNYNQVISPKGDKLALSVNPEPVIAYPERQAMGIADIDTGKVRVLVPNSNTRSFAWVSDEAIVYIDGSSTRRQIFKQLVDGKTRIQLTTAPDFREGVSVTNDGHDIAWISTAPNGTISLQAGDLGAAKISGIRTVATLANPTQGVLSGVTEPYYWKSADGLQLDGYLTLPVGYELGRRYPTIVIIHGGPTGFLQGSTPEEWPGQMNFIEYFAQRGYVVFVPDYRNSGNFGFDKIEEDRHHHRAMQSDFADIMAGVNSLERGGIADAQREAILGHSYGGLEVNWLITQTHHFRTAISYESGTDWYYEWGLIYGPNVYANWKLMGTPFTEPDVYRRNSSITYAGNIRTPTMFINAEDGINALSSIWLYAASLSNHVETKLVFYRGESHIIEKPDNERDLFLRIVRWMDGHLHQP